VKPAFEEIQSLLAENNLPWPVRDVLEMQFAKSCNRTWESIFRLNKLTVNERLLGKINWGAFGEREGMALLANCWLRRQSSVSEAAKSTMLYRRDGLRPGKKKGLKMRAVSLAKSYGQENETESTHWAFWLSGQEFRELSRQFKPFMEPWQFVADLQEEGE
jgi:hypothetical protein